MTSITAPVTAPASALGTAPALVMALVAAVMALVAAVMATRNRGRVMSVVAATRLQFRRAAIVRTRRSVMTTSMVVAAFRG